MKKNVYIGYQQNSEDMKMNDMNSALIEGTVVASPAVKAKSSVSGSSLVMFRIASNRYYKDRKSEEGKWLADTLYLDIACWGSLGDFCLESIAKGQTVRVVGRIKNSTYKSSDGSREYSRFSILAQHITFRQRKQSGEGEGEEEITLNAGSEENSALLAEPIVVYEY